MPPSNEDVRELSRQAAALGRLIPEPMKAFQSLMRAASAEGALTTKTKELMAVAISITSRCEGCVLFHVNNARRHGATREELAETIAVAIEMGGGPATVYGGKALAAFDDAAE